MNHSDYSTTFQELLNEYMKKNFDKLMKKEEDTNHLFNMFIAHLLLNLDHNQSKTMEKTEQNQLDELDQYLDAVINESKEAFEQTIQLLKEK